MSDSLRKFNNTQIEMKEPIRKAIGSATAEWLAAGGKIHVIKTPPMKPRPIYLPKPMPTVGEPEAASLNPWTDADENLMVRQLRTQGNSHATIAMAVNVKFGNKRSRDAVKCYCIKHKIYRTIIDKPSSDAFKRTSESVGPGGWDADEDTLLRDLAKTGKTIADIVEQLKLICKTDRSDASVRCRAKRLGLTVSKIRSKINCA